MRMRCVALALRNNLIIYCTTTLRMIDKYERSGSTRSSFFRFMAAAFIKLHAK